LSLRESGKRYVTYGHPWVGDDDPNVIIGTGVERIEGTELISTYRAEPHGTNEKADQVVNKLHFKSLTDASIEAYVRDGYSGNQERKEDPDLFYFSDSLLITWGVVMRGSNKNAMKRSRSMAMDSIQQAQLDITTDVEDLIESQRQQIRLYKARRKWSSKR